MVQQVWGSVATQAFESQKRKRNEERKGGKQKKGGRRAGMCWPRPGGGLSSWGHLKATSLRPAILAVYHGTISSVLALLGHNTLFHWLPEGHALGPHEKGVV